MEMHPPLTAYLADWAQDDSRGLAVADSLRRLAEAGRGIAHLIAQGSFEGDLSAAAGTNTDGDPQKQLDVIANDIVLAALKDSAVGWVASEELADAVQLRPDGSVHVAFDPLDGSSNIETNVSIGTIFSVLPVNDMNSDGALLQPGRRQLAAGYIIYGPQCVLVLTLGAGTHIFALDPEAGLFRLIEENIRIPGKAREFAINVSNFRHWDPPVRAYVIDCLDGDTGPRGQNYNMRWIASLVAECHRVMRRGGIFLYPGDDRQGYRQGRLRLLYEANPIAFLVEQAGGGATTGTQRVLEIEPETIHQRTPLIFGSKDKVERLERYHRNRHEISERAPLFANRGLFRA